MSTLRDALFDGASTKVESVESGTAGLPQQLSGGCLRGLAWALIFEAVAVAMMAFIVFEWHYLHL